MAFSTVTVDAPRANKRGRKPKCHDALGIVTRSRRKAHRERIDRHDTCDEHRCIVVDPPTIAKINEDNSALIRRMKTYDVSPEVKERWCEPIYINYDCHPGPYFSPSSLESLPKSIGPGPLTPVVQETLRRLVTVADAPKAVLNRWLYKPADDNDTFAKKFISVRYKTFKSVYSAQIRTIFNPEDLAEFCAELCEKIEACPNLFGTKEVKACALCGKKSQKR